MKVSKMYLIAIPGKFDMIASAVRMAIDPRAYIGSLAFGPMTV